MKTIKFFLILIIASGFFLNARVVFADETGGGVPLPEGCAPPANFTHVGCCVSDLPSCDDYKNSSNCGSSGDKFYAGEYCLNRPAQCAQYCSTDCGQGKCDQNRPAAAAPTTIPCGTNTTCTKTDKECPTGNDSECAPYVLLQGGIGKCSSKLCYLDPLNYAKQQSSPGTTDLVKDLQIAKPILEIDIPGLTFSDPSKNVDAEGYLHLPWISEYMGAIYKFALGIVTVVAVIMIMIQGVRIITSGGGEGKITGYKKIFQAVIGLVIAWGSYAILYNINPALVTFDTLKVLYIQPVDWPADQEKQMSDTQKGPPATQAGKEIATLLNGQGFSSTGCDPDTANAAAEVLDKAGVCVGPNHCVWTASGFLSNLGCGDVMALNSLSFIKQALQKGWVIQIITNQNRNNLPVGFLFTEGADHGGVSLGNGNQFQSGGGGWSGAGGPGDPAFIKKHPEAANCPQSNDATMSDPSLCSMCSKISAEAPGTGRFPGNNNQSWRKAKISGWRYIVLPPSQLGNFPGGVVNNPIHAQLLGNGGVVRAADVLIDKAVCDDTQNATGWKGGVKSQNDKWCKAL